MRDEVPYGEYVKLNKTGEILKLKGHDPKSQTFDIELQNGSVATVQWNEISRITGNKEAEFLSKKKN